MKPSKQWKYYALELMGERILQTQMVRYQSGSMERGQIREADAVEWYEFDQELTTRKIGFVTDDAHTMGCSPDRLIGESGLLEVKCPDQPAMQLSYILGDTNAHRDYRSQLQGQLMIAEREWVDIMCWHEVLPKKVIRVERDEKFIALLRAEICRVNEWIETEIDKIRTGGYVHVPQAKAALKDMLRASLGAVP
jgi:hypothetical protein